MNPFWLAVGLASQVLIAWFLISPLVSAFIL